jgi:ABC-type multidrug transport system fused ATPase/permease subunit
MIFWRFVAQKYLAYLVAVSVLLGGLYTLIEVLEKLARYRDIPVSSILSYAATAFIPSFIALFPIGALMSVALLLRELSLQGHLVSMAVYGIAPKRVVMVIGLCTLFAACGVFVLHESIGYRLARRMAQAKIWLLNREVPIDGWLRLGPSTFVLGMGSNKLFLLEGGKTSGIALVKGFVQGESAGRAESMMRVSFQSENSSLLKGSCIDTSRLDVLTYTMAEESCSRALSSLPSFYGRLLVADLFYFFLKIMLLPLFAMALFFLLEHRLIFRWMGVCAVYLMLGAVHACLQLLGPLLGLGVLVVLAAFLVVYFLRVFS